MLVCGFYSRPGGDEEPWAKIVSEARTLMEQYPHATTVLLGDANIHLSAVVEHAVGCSCLHCEQTPADQRIEALIHAAGFEAVNPAVPTHSSGTTIDLILSRPGVLPGAVVHPHYIGGSDHKLVYVTSPNKFQPTDSEQYWGG